LTTRKFDHYYNQPRCGRFLGFSKSFLESFIMGRFSFAAAIVATLFQVNVTPTMASPITYDLVGVTADFSNVGLGTDTLTGEFVFDPSQNAFSLPNITVTGPLDPGVYQSFIASSSSPPLELQEQSGPNVLFLAFGNPANGFIPLTGDTLITTVGLTISPGVADDVGAVTGSANPTPLPAALPLFGTALGGLGLLGWRRKWKAQVIAA
jgi:hypothetical protein